MTIGVIGAGAMGEKYAIEYAKAGENVYFYDSSQERMKKLTEEFGRVGSRIKPLASGREVSENSDLTFYLTPVESVEEAIRNYGPHAKKGAVASAGTSVMAPAIEAFERYLPEDVGIINWHWLFGPSLDPRKYQTVMVDHKSTEHGYKEARKAFESVTDNITELGDYKDHDKIMADSQVVTQFASTAMGRAWSSAKMYPWSEAEYAGGLDAAKILMMLRTYSMQPHVLSGIMMYNPDGPEYVAQYTKSVGDLFGMMTDGKKREFRSRVVEAGDNVFGKSVSSVLSDDSLLGNYSLGKKRVERKPNSHLSLFAMIDTWDKLKINPYRNLLFKTPPYQIRLLLTEYLHDNKELLNESIDAAFGDDKIKNDDTAFLESVIELNGFVSKRDSNSFAKEFNYTKDFFTKKKSKPFGKNMIEEGAEKSTEMIEMLSRVRRAI